MSRPNAAFAPAHPMQSSGMGPNTRLIVIVATCAAGALGALAALVSLVGAPVSKEPEVAVVQQLPPRAEQEDGLDLDHCEDKPDWMPSKCKNGSYVACWSAVPAVQWYCWPKDEMPSWVLTSVAANVICRAQGVGGPFDGACTLGTPSPRPNTPPALPAPLSWEAAYVKARVTLAQMNIDEKKTLLRGIGWTGTELQKWWYVGNTGAVPRLGIPSLNMQDAAGGFRTYWDELVGTVTCWPSLLSLAATWDPAAVQALGVALGEEFAGKGANAILGPSIDVHRVTRGGRNFEFLSGEDPYLGSKLAKAYIQGVQSKGVFTVMKHWIFNSQETNRETENSVVDERTAWELYYPPFQAAVEAGVSAAMCSYNQVDGVSSCSNEKQLLRVLKQQMGFQGFVQSDWWASHATSLLQGLDQEMPSTGRAVFFSAGNLETQPAQAIDEAVTRILAVVHRMNLSSSQGCAPPNCQMWFLHNVTSSAHVALARTLAAESIVLLKNKDAVLPISPRSVKTIAVIGAAAAAKVYNPNGQNQGANGWSYGDYYSGGGSGHVVAGRLVTPLDGITRRAILAGMKVVASATNDIDSALAAAKEADIAIVVAATTSGESADRLNLNLDNDADGLIAAVANQNQRTVVLVQAPGAVLMPWRDSVSGILALFLGGQETGTAWGDVLFGDHAPTGRLPITIPATDADTIAPSSAPTVTFSEGMATGYRNKAFIYAFPFGHGLTYTAFEYLSLNGQQCEGESGERIEAVICISATLKNIGWRSARTIAQLYLELPTEAGHPAPLLKGFQKTGVLLPGHVAAVTFHLSRKDLSFYNADQAKWEEAAAATARVGESSEDIRQSLHLLRVDGTGAWKAGRSSAVEHQVGPSPLAPTPALRPRLSPTLAPLTVPTPPQCSGSSLSEDCRTTQCCSEPGMQCYRKNPWWAACRAGCTPGSIDPLELKQYQTTWDCKPLGSRAASPVPGPPHMQDQTVPAVHTTEDNGYEEVVLRMKVSDVPRGWQPGTPITFLGDGGKEIHANVVHLESKPIGKAAKASQRPSITLALVVVGMCLPAMVVLALWAWWCALVKPTSREEGFLQWVPNQAVAVAEATKSLWTGFEISAASALVAMHRHIGGVGTKNPAIPPPSPRGNVPQHPEGSPTQCPLMR